MAVCVCVAARDVRDVSLQGKTSMARVVARLLRHLGVIDKGHLVEVTRKDLVAEYSGQSAVKTAAKVQDALGGVLFVDEAYSLKHEVAPSLAPA